MQEIEEEFEVTWYADLSEIEKSRLKTFVDIYVRETCLDLLTRAAFDMDYVSNQEFFEELSEEVVEKYLDMLMDNV